MTQQDLGSKYGEAAFETGRRLQPTSFERRVALRNGLDQHFTKLWLTFLSGLNRRNVLDERTRRLVAVGQFSITRSSFLEDGIRAALGANVPPREVLEVLFQTVVYGGNNVLDPALDVFVRVVDDLGLAGELESSMAPLTGRDEQRSLDDEVARWHEDDRNDPRLAELMSRHGWRGISTGVLVRPKEHINVLAYLDKMDADFAALWEAYTYQGLYGRGILDDKTRILCIIGNCVAIGEGIQIRNHIRSALFAGATPREVLEVLFQSCINFGMPGMMGSLAIFYGVIKDEGRLDEIGDPPFPAREHGRA